LIALDRTSSPGNWANEYLNHLDGRLGRSLSYLRSSSPAAVHTHIRSFLTLLQETHRYPSLTAKALELIAALHPMPVRWGLGPLWEPELLFAVNHIPDKNKDLRFEYLCDLGDVYLFSGQFEKAIFHASQVLEPAGATHNQAARAVRILFTCLRSTGQPQAADELIEHKRASFVAGQPAAEIPPEMAQAWLRFNQCELELMRERGEIDQALARVEDMIELDERTGKTDPLLTADLYTHRSTLRWVQGQYHTAANDLTRAIELFQHEEDQFNAECLQSNLGLVYLMMGDLDRSQKSLQSAIGYYRRTGSDQLLTFDIGNLGLVYFARGELDLALQLTREHIDHAHRLNFISEYNRGLRNLGTVLYYFGEFHQAIDALNTCHLYYEKRGSRSAYWLDLVWIGLCHYALDERNTAFTMVHAALEWSRRLESEVLEQLSLRGLAAFLPAAERTEALFQSLALARKNNRQQEEAAVLLMLAAVQRDAAHAETYWNQGCCILREIGAEKWLEGYSLQQPPFIPLLL
jgi:tetratricopeptide (TPR) repeat protein